MEDYCIDIIVGKDQTARSIRLDLPPFTLVGATTRAGDLSAPLRDRFGVISHLEYYSIDELQKIILRTAKIFAFPITDDAAYELANVQEVHQELPIVYFAESAILPKF